MLAQILTMQGADRPQKVRDPLWRTKETTRGKHGFCWYGKVNRGSDDKPGGTFQPA